MDIKQIKELSKINGFRPNKSLGQNFLVDNNVKNKIIGCMPDLGELTVIEIGPGFGMMTFDISEKCKKLIAIEKDNRLCDIMGPMFKEKGNIDLICQDILKTDLASLAENEEKKFLVYGNVPYYITTPIIEKMINARRFVRDLFMVVQEDLADRLVAGHGSRIYGSISCFVQYYTKPEKVFRIGANCFSPRPKVSSCLLKLGFLEEPSVKVIDEELLFRITRGAFSQRRKKAVNPLSHMKIMGMDRDAWVEVFNKAGIDPAKRAEGISLSDYALLADVVTGLQP